MPEFNGHICGADLSKNYWYFIADSGPAITRPISKTVYILFLPFSICIAQQTAEKLIEE
jgi:hypothetical protein